MSKKIIFFLFLLISSVIYADKTTINTDKFIGVKYREPIAGYTVSAIWWPKEKRAKYMTGPAIVQFNNIKNHSSFTLVNNHFSLEASRIDQSSLKNRRLMLDYHQQNLKSLDQDGFEGVKEPFFFADINFDGRQELVLAEPLNGQRSLTSFKVYQLENGNLHSDLYQITYQEPFRSLDSRSQLDKSRKEIIIHRSGGVCANINEYYQQRIVDGELKMVLAKVAEMDLTERGCYLNTYKISHKNRKLLSRKKLK